jgi:hypothetical protein
MYNGTLYEEYKAQLRDSNINDSLFVPYFWDRKSTYSPILTG